MEHITGEQIQQLFREHSALQTKDFADVLAAFHNAVVHLKAMKDYSLDDQVYDVREREGMGWDGPNVKAFSQAIENINSGHALLKYWHAELEELRHG